MVANRGGTCNILASLKRNKKAKFLVGSRARFSFRMNRSYPNRLLNFFNHDDLGGSCLIHATSGQVLLDISD